MTSTKILCAASWVAWLGACSSPTATTDAGAGPSAAIASGAAGSAAASSAPAVTGDTAGAVPIDPGWVSENPAWTQLLLAASPGCTRREGFTEADGKSSHSYEVLAPSIAQTDLQQRFAAAAKGSGLTVSTQPVLGDGVADEKLGVWATVHDGRVMLGVEARAPVRERVGAIAEASGLESWELAKSLGDGVTWRAVSFAHGARGVDVEWDLGPPHATKAKVDAWAQKRRLERDGEGWLRPVSKTEPDRSVMVITPGKEGRITVFESHAIDMAVPACRPHASRVPGSGG